MTGSRHEECRESREHKAASFQQLSGSSGGPFPSSKHQCCLGRSQIGLELLAMSYRLALLFGTGVGSNHPEITGANSLSYRVGFQHCLTHPAGIKTGRRVKAPLNWILS